MKRSIVGAVVVALLVPALSNAADRDRHYAGSTCRATRSADQFKYRLRSTFIQPTASAMEIFCPITIDRDSVLPRSTIGLAWVRAYYTDANSTLGAAGDLKCDLEVVGASGSWTTTPYRYACSQWGGCTDSTNGLFLGGVLSFSLAANNAMDTNLAYGVHAVGLRCSLPASGTYWSELRSYGADLSYQ